MSEMERLPLKARIVRVLIYEGDPELLAKDAIHWGAPINGIKKWRHGRRGNMTLTSQIVEFEGGICIRCGTPTNQYTMICETCMYEAERAVKEFDPSRVGEEEIDG